MAETARILFIIEGTKIEPQVIRSMEKYFLSKFKKYKYLTNVLLLPSRGNIYSLWEELNEDDDLKVIDVCIEKLENASLTKTEAKRFADFSKISASQFSEIYLFFDYDGHNRNIPEGKNTHDIVSKMLNTFDNETDKGKLYLSYPMVEAIRHFSDLSMCPLSYECKIKIEEGRNYKKIVSDIACITDFKRYDDITWDYVVNNFLVRLSCLLGLKETISMDYYKQNTTPNLIYENQYKKYISIAEQVMILSGMPEFILDYFRKDNIKEYFQNIEETQFCECDKVI